MPLLDGLRYSRFFFQQFPQTIFLLQPLQPLVSMYYRVPFAGVISFFAIYMGLAENQTMSRFVRFNAMQAIIVDVCLVLPGMSSVLSPAMSGAAMEMYKLCFCVWVVVLAAFCLAVGCLSGRCSSFARGRRRRDLTHSKRRVEKHRKAVTIAGIIPRRRRSFPFPFSSSRALTSSSSPRRAAQLSRW